VLLLLVLLLLLLCCRAAYTRQRRAVTFDTTHVLEPVPSTTPTSAPRTIGRPPTTPSGNFHTVTFLSRSNSWMHPRGEESANTFGHLDAAAVRDEQGNDVTFASRNNEVSGGGVAHIMNAVSTCEAWRVTATLQSCCCCCCFELQR
jgi:hypothetical protein